MKIRLTRVAPLVFRSTDRLDAVKSPIYRLSGQSSGSADDFCSAESLIDRLLLRGVSGDDVSQALRRARSLAIGQSVDFDIPDDASGDKPGN
jgi:hypothetical protein